MGVATAERPAKGAPGPDITGMEMGLPARGGIESIPEPLRELHKNRRILVVDDDRATCNHVKQKLGLFFREEDGCSIEFETDPLKAADRIIGAKNEGRPYDLIVLDFSMKDYTDDGTVAGMNGDELLIMITQAGAFVPTVTFSGDWSSQVKVHTFDQLAGIERSDQLKAAELSVDRELKGVPITPVPKWDIPHLVRALEAVQLTSGETDMEKVREHVATLKPAWVESNYTEKQLERLAELAGRFGELLKDFMQEAGERYPGLKNTEWWEESTEMFQETLKDIESGRFGITGFSGEAGRQNVHSFTNQMNGARVNTALETIEGYANYDSIQSLLNNPDFSDFMQGWYDIFQSNLHEALRLSVSSEKQTVYAHDINERIANRTKTSVFRAEANLSGEQLVVEAPATLDHILEEPILNAKKAIRGIKGGRVVVSTAKTRVSTLPDKQKGHFHSIGLVDDDFVAEVRVSDNGPGIPPEKLARINAGEHVEGTFETTGFGLDFIAQNMQKCNGTYHVESEVGKGTEFITYFKLADGE